MFRFSVITVSILFLHGCAFINALNSELPQQIDQWLVENEYGKALNTLKHVSSSHKYYALLMNKKRQVLRKAKEFSKNNYTKAQTAEKNVQWHKANSIYKNALNKLPENSLLKTRYQGFIKRRDAYLDNLEYKLSLSKGNWLIESTPIQKNIISANPENTQAQYRYQDTVAEIEKTAQQLLKCTETALQAGKILLAENCLQTVSKLDKSSFNKKSFKKFKQQLAVKHQQQQTILDNKTTALIRELKQGYSHDNLLRAQRHLVILENKRQPSQHSKKLSKKLRKLFKRGVANRIQAGQRLYSNGKIKNALSIWVPLQEITPDNNKLKDYISRARRVLAKVKKLSNKPATIKLP